MINLNHQIRGDLYHPDLLNALGRWTIFPVFTSFFEEAKNFTPLARQQYVDIKTYLVDDILVKVDRMSMLTSLETRVPLLDYHLVEFMLNLPDKMKINKGITKKILRDSAKDLLPESILTKPKQGFSIPLKDWLRGPLKNIMMELISPENIQKNGYFNPEVVRRMIESHLSKKANHSHRLWTMMVFESWRQANSSNY
jgi:asparagine synthase (glutamine-hydrolysing)